MDKGGAYKNDQSFIEDQTRQMKKAQFEKEKYRREKEEASHTV